MTLGEKLKATLDAKEEEKRESVREALKASAERAKKRAIERQNVIDSIKKEIESKILAGKEPAYKLRGPSDIRGWINACHLRSDGRIMEDGDVWMGLQKWLESEGLRLKIGFGHDGTGENDWLEITVEVLPEMEVEAD